MSARDISDFVRSTEVSEDMLALRELAEAVEACVRGGQEGNLGLDWGSGE